MVPAVVPDVRRAGQAATEQHPRDDVGREVHTQQHSVEAREQHEHPTHHGHHDAGPRSEQRPEEERERHGRRGDLRRVAGRERRAGRVRDGVLDDRPSTAHERLDAELQRPGTPDRARGPQRPRAQAVVAPAEPGARHEARERHPPHVEDLLPDEQDVVRDRVCAGPVGRGVDDVVVDLDVDVRLGSDEVREHRDGHDEREPEPGRSEQRASSAGSGRHPGRLCGAEPERPPGRGPHTPGPLLVDTDGRKAPSARPLLPRSDWRRSAM